jgi:glycolate oxidase FAD binding subunit
VSVVSEQLQGAHANRRAVRIEGAGTWRSGGRPVTAATTISLANDRGIVEYVPGDLTLTARAGTPLSDIDRATTEHGQWLPLDPWGGDDGTLGATVSTGTAGPYTHAMGLPRDVVLGLEFVTGTGDVVRAGGKVVKNVAGFDLTRLVVGSWGTLGVITEVTVRLRARPDRTRSVAIVIPRERLDDLAVDLRALPFTPFASELVNAALSQHLGLGPEAALLIQVGGNEQSIRSQIDLLSRLGTQRDLDDGIWQRMRTIAVGQASWRWSRLPSAFGGTWRVAESAADATAAYAHGNPARGVVRVVVPDASRLTPRELAGATTFDGTLAIESLPANAWPAVEFAPAQDPVSRAIRSKFDPAGILNPGILGPP